MYSMDDETFRALRVILDDHFGDCPAGSPSTTGDDIDRLHRAYEVVAAWTAIAAETV